MCKDEVGNQYIVEMQVAKEKGFTKRAQYYAAKAYGSQLNTGTKYSTLKEVIFLAIADFIMFPEKANYKSDREILDRNSLEHDLQDFSFTFLELGKFNKSINELQTMIERWAYFFKHTQAINKENLAKIIGNENIMQKAYEELDRFNWDEEELQAYEAVIKKEMDYESVMDQKYDEGLEKGIEKGKADGEAEKAKNIAKKMLTEAMDINLIAKLTNLSIDEIRKL